MRRRAGVAAVSEATGTVTVSGDRCRRPQGVRREAFPLSQALTEHSPRRHRREAQGQA